MALKIASAFTGSRISPAFVRFLARHLQKDDIRREWEIHEGTGAEIYFPAFYNPVRFQLPRDCPGLLANLNGTERPS